VVLQERGKNGVDMAIRAVTGSLSREGERRMHFISRKEIPDNYKGGENGRVSGTRPKFGKEAEPQAGKQRIKNTRMKPD